MLPRRGRGVILAGGLALALVGSVLLTRPGAVPSVGVPVAAPASVPAGTPTWVVVTTQITDPTVIAGGVNLQRVSATGTVLATLGVMRDDGQGADAVAADGVFTLGVVVNEPAPGELRLRVSAAFRGLLRRQLSPVTVVPIVAGVPPPVAAAGTDQNALVGTPVVLDGTASHDPGGAVITFQWTVAQAPAGSAAVLAPPGHPTPSFVPDVAGTYAFDLVVHNGLSASAPDRVTVTAFAAGAPPNARAGRDQTVLAGAPVTLDGSASFHPDGGPLLFQWSVSSRPAGSGLTDAGLVGAGDAVAGFTPDVPGAYVLALTVTAGPLSETDTVQVLALAANVPPRAEAGDDRASRVAPIALDGSASVDPDGGPSPLAFAWTLVSRPPGSARTTADIAGAATAGAGFVPDVDGAYLFRLRVGDGAASDEDNVLVVFTTNRPPVALDDDATTPENVPVTVAVLANDGDPDGDALAVSLVTPPAGGNASVNADGSVTYTPAAGFVGTDGFTYAIDDGFGGVATATVTVTVTGVNDFPTVALAAVPLGGTAPLDVVFTATATDPDGDALTYTWDFGDGTVVAGAAGETHTYATAGTFTATVTVSDGALSATASVTVVVDPAGPPLPPLPPDPATLAPPVPTATATDIAAATEFLYTGPDAIQTGVAPGTIDARKVAVLRGRVITREGAPLPAVTVSVHGRPELGQTLSRADGAFDLAVNGGGPVTIVCERAGHLAAQRTVTAPWRDFVVLPDVALVPLDAQATVVDLAAATVQVARGTPVADAAGARQATLLFMPGTTATLTLADGSVQPLPALTVRATEFTVGPNGPAAMPGLLPPTSAYTYAAELSADEALATGATQVTFSQPVFHYVENFLGFPVGGSVPTGYYDRQRAAWVASDNGRVVAVVSVTGGLADLDTDGDGVADSGLAVSDAERQALAALYAPGQSLWRAPIPHFTPWDLNWPYAPPADAVAPSQPPARPAGLDDGCDWISSIIQCQNQTLAEELPVTGTPYRLRYQSDRVPGRVVAYTADIPVTGPVVPASLLRVRLELSVAGRRFVQELPAAPDQTFRFTWDGRDAYGRVLQGTSQLYVKIAYVYTLLYFPPADAAQSFAQISRSAGQGSAAGITLAVPDVTRNEITISQEYATSIGAWDARAAGLGGWSLSVHHGYDPPGRVAYLGDGGRRSGQSAASVIEAFAGPNSGRGFSGDGGPAATALLHHPRGLASGPDGSVYIADMGNHRIRRVAPDNRISTVAGSGVSCFTADVDACVGAFAGDGGLATQALLNKPQAVAVAPDGSLLIADTSNFRIRRVDQSGIISTIAGTGLFGSTGDRGLATLARIGFVAGLAVAPDGSIYFSEATAVVRIRRIDPRGIINTVAGGGAPVGSNGDGGAATAARLTAANGLALGPDGSIYTLDLTSAGSPSPAGVRKISPDGIIRTIAAIPGLSHSERYLAFGPDGRLYATICCPNNIGTLRVINPEGTTTVVGGGVILTTDVRFIGPNGDGGAATQADLLGPQGVTVLPDGTVYVGSVVPSSILAAGAHRVRRIRPPFPGFSVADTFIASEDGTEAWVFDARGRHLRTHDTLTGVARHAFTYDASGRLATVTDVAGNVTTVERGGDGTPVAIVAPGGQRTTLAVDAAGFLAAVTNPAGETTRPAHAADGLLATFTRPGGGVSRLTYDALGYLIRDETPDGNALTLTRTETATGFTVEQRSALGRTITYGHERLPDGSVRQRTTDPSGRVTEVVTDVRGTQTGTFPDGTGMILTTTGDPRFGGQVAGLARLVVTLPSGSTSTTTNTRSVTLPASGSVLSPASVQNTTIVNGRTQTIRWQASTQTITSTSPAGRQNVVTLDALGRVVSLAPGAGLAPVTWSYDGLGRVGQVTRGAQSWTFAYDAQHRLITRIDALGGQTRFEYDGADRITRIERPSGQAVRFTYDPDGNRTSVIMPSGAVHALGYTPAGRDATYTPPGGGAMTRGYDADGAAVLTTLAGGRARQSTYDAGGRATRLTFPEAVLDFAYDAVAPTTGASRLTRTPGTGPAQDIAFTYDGPLPRTAAWTGTAAGQYTYGYDANFFLTSLNLASGADAAPIAITRDVDGLPTGYGPFTITRGGPDGAPSAMTDGTATVGFGWDGLGRLVDRTLTVAGVQAYRVQLVYDAAGRLTQKTETTGAGASVFDYALDADGQLLETRRDGVLVEQYAYDANSNRTSRTLPGGGVEAATYDAADRLTQRGGMGMVVDADGFLVARGADTFQYDTVGALTGATVPAGAVSYAYDAVGRRVARTDAAGTTQYLFGNPSAPMQLTAVRDPAGQLTALFYDEQGALIALERAGARFYVATDHLGTPRVVTDATGTVVKTLAHDSFGVLLADSDPAFVVPVGFAGGLPDPATGLLRFGYRDYEPAAGRWTARDPVLYSGGQANLYAYVGNAPTANRDPLGLWCIGASFYAGFGLGLQVCSTGNDLAVCGETGFGLGGGVGAGNGMPRDSETVGLEAAAQCGPVGLGFAATLDDCGDFDLGPTVQLGPLNVGPVSIAPGTVSAGTTASSDHAPGRAAASRFKSISDWLFSKGAKCSVGGKLAGSICRNLF